MIVIVVQGDGWGGSYRGDDDNGEGMIDGGDEVWILDLFFLDSLIRRAENHLVCCCSCLYIKHLKKTFSHLPN